MDELEWTRPRTAEVALAGGFVAKEGPSISIAFAGSSRLDTDLVEFVPEPTSFVFEDAMRSYIRDTLQVSFDTWDDSLTERLRAMEEGYRNRKKGFWQSFWRKMGDQKTTEAWLCFIPDESGMCVLKGGLSLIFLLASKSCEKRQKILDTFSALQDAVVQASPEKTTFRFDPRVQEASTQLRTTFDNSIEDLFLLLSKKPGSAFTKLRTSLKKGAASPMPLPTMDDILNNLQEATKTLTHAVDNARDRTIERTEIVGLHMAQQAYFLQTEMSRSNHLTSRLAEESQKQTEATYLEGKQISGSIQMLNGDIDQLTMDAKRLSRKMDDDASNATRLERKDDFRHEEIISFFMEGKKQRSYILKQLKEEERRLESFQRYSRTNLTRFLLEQKRDRAEIAKLKKCFSQLMSLPLLNISQLFEILAQQRAERSWDMNAVDLRPLSGHANDDLRQALAGSGRFPSADRQRLDSLVRYDRFRDWADPRYSDLVLIEANVSSAALSTLSASSAFCGNFIASLADASPSAVVAHFFCGLHVHPRDFLHGPPGLVRSLAAQLLSSLLDMDISSLEFIHDSEYVEELEDHHLPSLCTMLHSLLRMFPANVDVYLIIDAISCFDADGTFEDLAFVLECLQGIMDDCKKGVRGVQAVVKVLLITPALSTQRLRDVLMFKENCQLITLN